MTSFVYQFSIMSLIRSKKLLINYAVRGAGHAVISPTFINVG